MAAQKKLGTPTKKYMRVRHVSVDVYRSELSFYCGGTFEMVKKDVKSIALSHAWEAFEANCDGVEDEKTTLGHGFPLPGGGFIIWMPAPYDDAVLVHEIEHAVHHVMLTKGIQLSKETTEPYAYLAEYLFKEFRLKIK